MRFSSLGEIDPNEQLLDEAVWSGFSAEGAKQKSIILLTIPRGQCWMLEARVSMQMRNTSPHIRYCLERWEENLGK